MRLTIVLAAGVLLLSGCASSGTRDGLVYRDGSWYSPASEGLGDYYTGASTYDDAWDHPYVFGIGMSRYGGYCPVRYRYCTSFWADPFFGRYYGFYDPFYDPYWYQPWIYYHQSRHRPHPRRHVGMIEPGEELSVPVVRERAERPQPRSWEERPARRPMSERSGEARPRRQAPLSGDGQE